MNNVCGIEFKSNGKIYNFLNTFEQIKIDDHVIVETEKGNQYGKVVKTNVNVNDNPNNLRSIIRIANENDFKIHLDNLEAADRALKNARNIAKELGLEMNIIDANYTYDKKQLLFNFIANERIDFRELVKKLASVYHTRIELRQIGVRDKAREVGGIGQCGRKLCCSEMIENIDSITINMAKNQNIALNPNKINGCCGRLLCCLSYEDELYTKFREGMPQIGAIINTKYGSGKVESIDILNRKYCVIINGERKTINLD